MKCDYCNRTSDECRIKTIKGKAYCPKHITQHYRDRLGKHTIYDKNDVIIEGDIAKIILRNKEQEIVGEAIVDTEDLPKCLEYKWHIRKNKSNNYAITTLSPVEKLHLHRLVLNYEGALDIDHINRNGLDNRKSNLRIVNHSANLANNGKTGVKQVPSGKYQASCTRNYRSIYIGTYDTFDEAVRARNDFISKL